MEEAVTDMKRRTINWNTAKALHYVLPSASVALVTVKTVQSTV
jgi:hypothetical protein